MGPVVAALIAAAAALIATVANIWTARFAARRAQETELQRWRREVLLPPLAGFLEASARLEDQCRLVSYAESKDDAKAARRDFDPALRKLMRFNAQVELVASKDVRALAHELQQAHMRTDVDAYLLSQEEPTPDSRQRLDHSLGKVKEHRRAFLMAARVSLGIPHQ